MQRIGFRLQLDIGRIDEYVDRHKNVWPDMQAALTEAGWQNYTLFLDRSDATLFGYFETVDYEAAMSEMAQKEVNDHWQASMGQFFVALAGLRPDEGLHRLEAVFYLA